MVHRFTSLVVAGVAALTAASAHGQYALEPGRSAHRVAQGIDVPLQMDFDASGALYVGSGHVDPVNGDRVPIWRLSTDGTLESLPPLVRDPDALVVGSNGLVYTGAAGGRLFRIDPMTWDRRLWVHDPALGNVDGLAWAGGQLYTVAFDHPRVYRVDPVTRQVSLFVDLSSIGFTGLTGLAFDPFQARWFIGSPLENRVALVDTMGTVVDGSFASGFTFVGHLAFDPSGSHGADLFAADNGAGAIERIDVQTGVRSTYLTGLDPLTGGLVFDAEGRLFTSALTNDGTFGELWSVDSLALHHEGGPPGTASGPRRVRIAGRADAGRTALLLASLDDTGRPLSGGRWLPIGPGPLAVLARGPLDSDGSAIWRLPPWLDGVGLRGLDVHFAVLTMEGGRLAAISDVATLSLPANRPPVADAGPDLAARTGFPVELRAGRSRDPDRDALHFSWDLGDGSAAQEGARLAHAYAAAGSYLVQLTAEDGAASDVDSLVVTVQDNTPPNADAGGDRTATVGEVLTFDGSGSSDADGDGLQWSWSFGDGSGGAQGVTVQHAYTAAGTYEVVLRLGDGYEMVEDRVAVVVH